ncbi:d-arabinitol dehydrogenase [Niveomyces insectorum RCEF 264]|uniref:D-arabinitol dehydrogenase n=1 Tax=Niveomyces insectorum RCEF 264 TaxID=1081102 RepID=A0A167VBS3_9HYPO|nr:d-arabinitol dehydrogenase [Niveomyces insectorum RCEF 264]
MATAVARHLAARGNAPGSMVLVGSMSGAVVNWAPAGVRVNCLSPGYMETPLTGALMDAQPALRQQWTGGVPMGRLGAPTDLAGPVVFMLSDAASYMTGADLRVDGGYTII